MTGNEKGRVPRGNAACVISLHRYVWTGSVPRRSGNEAVMASSWLRLPSSARVAAAGGVGFFSSVFGLTTGGRGVGSGLGRLFGGVAAANQHRGHPQARHHGQCFESERLEHEVAPSEGLRSAMSSQVPGNRGKTPRSARHDVRAKMTGHHRSAAIVVVFSDSINEPVVVFARNVISPDRRSSSDDRTGCPTSRRLP